MKRAFGATVALLGVSACFLAIGSAEEYENPSPRGALVETVHELVSKRPDLQAQLSGLRLEVFGYSAYLWPSQSSPLRGTRVGPFVLLAKPRGSKGPATLRVVMNTHQRYFDSMGKDLPSAKGATELDQTVVSLQLIPLEPPDSSLVGSWRLMSTGGTYGRIVSSATWVFESNRGFKAVQVNIEGTPSDFEGYFLASDGELTIGRTNRNLFQKYEYTMSEGVLHVSAKKQTDGPALIEWTFERQAAAD